jgi:hypothetical protein
MLSWQILVTIVKKVSASHNEQSEVEGNKEWISLR